MQFRILRYEKVRDLQVFTNHVLLLGAFKGGGSTVWGMWPAYEIE